MAKMTGLGKGLDALFGGAPLEANNNIVEQENIEDVEKYYSIALENDFEISYKEENKIAIKELPIGKIELSVSYGETPYTNSYAFYAQAKLIKSI